MQDVELYLSYIVSPAVQDLENMLGSLMARHEALRAEAKAAGVDLTKDNVAEDMFNRELNAKKEDRAEGEEECLARMVTNDRLGNALQAHAWDFSVE